MARSRKSLQPMLGLGATLALAGCVDMFTGPPPADAVRLARHHDRGQSGLSRMRRLRVRARPVPPPTFLWDTISGRAWPTAVPDSQLGKWAEAYTQWWVEGYVTKAEFVQFETKMQQPGLLRRPALCGLARHHRRGPAGAGRVRLTLQPRGGARPQLNVRLGRPRSPLLPRSAPSLSPCSALPD